ncbi:hypothetical protein EDB80DRAFT_734603 [Ilyonectria destructans]|nr:hypothetical protein EDB80DRAFT_734603 [Ilyonectria destructans]
MRILPHSLLLSSLYLFRHSASADADATDETYVVCLHDVFRRITPECRVCSDTNVISARWPTAQYDRQEGGDSGHENPKMDGSLLEISFYC